MNLDELKHGVYADLKIDNEHLDTESLKNQEIKASSLSTNFFCSKQKETTKVYTVISGNTMVVRLMLRFILVNPLTLKF